MDIQDVHPLRDKVEMEHIFPPLAKFFPKKKKGAFLNGLKKSLMNELDFKIPKNDLLIENDPYLSLGYGVNAYFDLLFQLMTMFLVISVICLPIFFIYGTGGGFVD